MRGKIKRNGATSPHRLRNSQIPTENVYMRKVVLEGISTLLRREGKGGKGEEQERVERWKGGRIRKYGSREGEGSRLGKVVEGVW